MADLDFDLSPEDQSAPVVMSDEERRELFEEPHASPETPDSGAAQPSESAASGDVDSLTEPSPDAQAAPEPTPEPEAEPEDGRQKTVPHQALHEEREIRKELQRKVETYEARFNAFVEKMAAQNQTPQPDPNAPPDPQVPDFDEDPAENLNARLARQEETAAKLATLQQQAAEQAAQQQQIAAFQSNFQNQESQFASTNPDYYEATNYLRQGRMQELKLMGYNDAQAQQAVDAEALNYAIVASNQGQDPVKLFYEVAKQRGFRGPSAPAPAPAPAGSPSPQVDLKQLQENMDRSESMGPGGATPHSITLSDLANMTDSEFDKATSGEAWENLWN